MVVKLHLSVPACYPFILARICCQLWFDSPFWGVLSCDSLSKFWQWSRLRRWRAHKDLKDTKQSLKLRCHDLLGSSVDLFFHRPRRQHAQILKYPSDLVTRCQVNILVGRVPRSIDGCRQREEVRWPIFILWASFTKCCSSSATCSCNVWPCHFCFLWIDEVERPS